jgi:menaquinol-cytochrome c reductase iron-sulfur subunit
MIDESRRRFLTRLSLGLTGLITAVVGVPILGYLLGPLVRPVENEWRVAGKVADWKVGETKLVKIENPASLPWAGTTAESAAWLRRSGDASFVAFSVHCTHLGCPVNWLDDAKLFLCPCHGGVFYADGTVAGGPPPRELFQREWRVEGGRLLVKTQRLPTAGGGRS